MPDAMYAGLCSPQVLKRAWYLARDDARDAFVTDPYHYYDFEFDLDRNLERLADALATDAYHPQPMLRIDVPKSPLAVRPGSIPEIEDWVVLFAITYLIAPRLDGKIPEQVYSYRLRSKAERDQLFQDVDVLEFPLLGKRQVVRPARMVEPWYETWPQFVVECVRAYTQEGYQFLSVADVAAYFENIDLDILRTILVQHLPKEQKIVNLLISMLQAWGWRTTHGACIGRGIPQGNEVSSFLGNVYLLPLDSALQRFCRVRGARWLRYMDDVKVFCKEERRARRAVFTMNEALRGLQLNMRGAKTQVLRDQEIEKELLDERVTRVSEVIDEIHRARGKIQRATQVALVRRLRQQYKCLPKRGTIITGKDMRLLRRLVTGFSLLRDPSLVHFLLGQVRLNPDQQLMEKTVTYLALFPRKRAIGTAVSEFINAPENVFSLQQAQLLTILRNLRTCPRGALDYARRTLRSPKAHWYVRVQCALLLDRTVLPPRSLSSLRHLYAQERHQEIKRALIRCLCQLSQSEQAAVLREAVLAGERKVSRIAGALLQLREKPQAAQRELDRLLPAGANRPLDEGALAEAFYRVEVIKFTEHEPTRHDLRRRLRQHRSRIRDPRLRQRVCRVLRSLDSRAPAR